MKGYRVRYTLATKLVNELVEAADERVLKKRSPATAVSTFCVLTNSATWNWTAMAPNSSSRF